MEISIQHFSEENIYYIVCTESVIGIKAAKGNSFRELMKMDALFYSYRAGSSSLGFALKIFFGVLSNSAWNE